MGKFGRTKIAVSKALYLEVSMMEVEWGRTVKSRQRVA